jgi:hypothetical protein
MQGRGCAAKTRSAQRPCAQRPSAQRPSAKPRSDGSAHALSEFPEAFWPATVRTHRFVDLLPAVAVTIQRGYAP